MEKPTLPKGTRDFGPAQMAKRQFILENIKKVFQKYGFQPLETPAMENLTTLTGKYGEEGDQLLFKILDSGDFTSDLKGEQGNEDNIIDLITKTKFRIISQDLYDDVNRRVGIEKDMDENTLKDIINDSLQSLTSKKEDSQVLSEYKFRVKDNLDTVTKNIKNWFVSSKETAKAEDPKSKDYYLNLLVSFLKERNRNIDDIISVFFKKNYITPFVTSKGLRYDLTVPFARFVVMNRNEITFPFKRYQIQPVWRADRPQKGRYREFYQCDADVVGTDSLICEAEIVLMIKEVFKRLGIEDYSIKVNHRGILSGLAELCDAKGNETSLFIAIDKLDKIGEEKVKEELRTRGFSENNLTTLFEILNFNGTIQQKIEFLTSKFSTTPTGQKGINDFKEVLRFLSDYGASEDHVEFDMTLARGLSYYTGCIFEVKINKVSIGSVSGGGRYDNLTGVFGLPGVSGVGFSFGVDRLYDAMEELKLFPQEAQISTQVLIAHFDAESKRYGLKVLQTLRENGIASEIYPDSVKIQKQLDFANKKMVPYVMVIGSEEVKSGMLSFKNMKTGEQFKLTIEDILKRLNVGNGQ